MAEILAIRTAQSAESRQEFALAATREREAAQARDRADARTRAALDAWNDHLDGTRFEPELSRAFGSEFIVRMESGDVAANDLAERASERAGCEAEWRSSDARSRQARDLFDANRRALSRDREERALDALTDRITFNWGRK